MLINVGMFPTVRSWLELIREKVSASSTSNHLDLQQTLPELTWRNSSHHFPPHLQAGYVSGMLAPVGIGISGALLIVGALYGLRTLHRRRRNHLKHQRKTRQQEVSVSRAQFSSTIWRLKRFCSSQQPGEAGSGSQDQAMLLADSSEDEF